MFIMKNKKKPQIEEFLMKNFDKYGYSHSEIRKTHTGIDITIYADKPGLIIGRGGENINEVSEELKKNFGFQNARIDVQEIEKPYLNSKIVAEDIKGALQRGFNFRRIGNIMLRKVMESGAIGCEIRLAGKLGSSKSRVQRFYDGYLKYSGETAKEYVDYAKTTAITKAGTIGIKVRIMKEYPEAKIKEIKEVEKERKPKNLECPYCGKVYDKERSLKIHIGQKHAEEDAKEKGRKIPGEEKVPEKKSKKETKDSESEKNEVKKIDKKTGEEANGKKTVRKEPEKEKEALGIPAEKKVEGKKDGEKVSEDGNDKV